MLFKEFCEKALSNDLIGIVPDVTRGEPADLRPAYRWLLDQAPELEKPVERFTYGRTTVGDNAGKYILYVSLMEEVKQ